MILDPGTLVLLFAVAVAAGFVDSIAGGGGLLTMPALLSCGLSPAQALGTNKLQACFGSFSASAHFVHAGSIDPRSIRVTILSTFVGSALGSVAVRMLPSDLLARVVPLLLICVAAFFLLSPNAGRIAGKRRMSEPQYALFVAPALGFYDGFFGPGTGTFMALSGVALLGLELGAATARTKVLNFTSNIASLAIFLAGGQILWTAGLVMAAGQALGARLGSRLVLKRGAAIVRPFLVVVSLAITLHLLTRL